ncbi:MAG: DUF1573 domain-containing protein [Candidatus Omnitrophota bacterium]|nr:DUF1573 domain-containing protein [Candidatus Omnitrophota bacterium]
MKIRHKISSVILFALCLLLSFQIVFAQDISALKADIYPKIGCIICKNMTIDKCNCPQSREMKAYIEALLETGVPREEIFYKVAKKFSLKAIMDRQIQAGIEKRLIKEAGDKRPQIFVEPSTINFGEVSKKQGVIRAAFNLSNKGKADLIITNIKTSCGCVAVSLQVGKDKSPVFGTGGAPTGWQMVIKPKTVGQIELVIDLLHPTVHKGHLLREFSIFSNDPIHPETTVIVEAEVGE